MFCPKCRSYLTESIFLKTNKKLVDGVLYEYDANCPNCAVLMGRVVWGQLQLNAAFLEDAPLPDTDDPDAPLPDVGDPATPAPKCCPHCGKELPADL